MTDILGTTKSNPNPEVHSVTRIQRKITSEDDENTVDEFDELEIFDLIRNISDPEHPFTLEQLKVAQLENIKIDKNIITVYFTPTIEHCSLATLIGLCIRVKLLRSLPKRFKVDIYLSPGSHATEESGKVDNKNMVDRATSESPIE